MLAFLCSCLTQQGPISLCPSPNTHHKKALLLPQRRSSHGVVPPCHLSRAKHFHPHVSADTAMSRSASWVTYPSCSCFLSWKLGIITVTYFTGQNDEKWVKPLAQCPQHDRYSRNTLCYYFLIFLQQIPCVTLLYLPPSFHVKSKSLAGLDLPPASD